MRARTHTHPSCKHTHIFITLSPILSRRVSEVLEAQGVEERLVWCVRMCVEEGMMCEGVCGREDSVAWRRGQYVRLYVDAHCCIASRPHGKSFQPNYRHAHRQGDQPHLLLSPHSGRACCRRCGHIKIMHAGERQDGRVSSSTEAIGLLVMSPGQGDLSLRQ